MEISDLAGRIRDHRFDGWTDTAIADEIEKFSQGDGIGSIGTAVEALKAVATALADTDKTLRDQLTKLGVEWQSQAGGAAGQVFTEQAGFSQDAMGKVAHTAELLFTQGEAFNRTKFKLPDPDTLLKGAGGYNIGDNLLSLIGFETDHAEAVDAAQNSRGQALEALNAYAQQSGENLLQSEPLSRPQSLSMTPPDSGKGPLDLAGSAVDLTPDGSVAPASASVQSQYVAPPVAQQVSQQVDPPTPAFGLRAPGGSAGSGGTTAPAASGGAVVPPVPSGRPPSGAVPGTTPPGWEMPPASGPRPGTGGPGVGGAGVGGPGGSGGAGRGFGGVPGNSSGPGSGGAGFGGARSGGVESGGVGGGTGGSVSGGARTEGFAGHGPVAGTGGEPALGRGRLVGSGPQAPLAPGGGAATPPVVKPGLSAGEVGAGAAALGAGAGASALAGDRERQGRGFGGPAKGPVSPLPVELPEEDAIALRKTEQVAPEPPPGDPKFLGPAATQAGDEGEHVRRFGIDDKDLFTDGRMVSDDVIGDDA